MATFLTLTPIVRVARVPLHPRERFRVQTAAVGAGCRRGVRGRRGNRVRGRNETGARSFHDALQWLMCTEMGTDASRGDSPYLARAVKILVNQEATRSGVRRNPTV